MPSARSTRPRTRKRTAALIAYSTTPRGEYGGDHGGGWTEYDWDIYLSELAEGWGTPDYAKRQLEWAAPSIAADPAQRRWWTRLQRLSASPNAIAARERVWRQFDIRAVLPTIQIPTLVLHRTADAVDNVEAGRDLARRIIEAIRPLGIEVRTGVHTGEVETIDGKAGGLGVVIGARVGALAGASEVLTSQTVKDLTTGSGLVFEDAGEHELKGVPDRWHLYRVVSERT